MKNNEEIKNLKGQVRELRKEVGGIKDKVNEIHEYVEEGYVGKDKKDVLDLQEDGNPNNIETAKIIKRAKKTRKGADTNFCMDKWGVSNRHALTKMRELAKQREDIKFRKGKGNKASRLLG